MKKVRWLDRRIALAGPCLALVLHESEFDAALKHLGVSSPGPWIASPSAHATTSFFESPDGPLTAVVAMRQWEGRDPLEVAGLLVHEAVHVWQRYASDMGEHEPGAEQEAYAIQAIAQELMAEFARRMNEAVH